MKVRVQCSVCGGGGVVSDYGPLGEYFFGAKEYPQCEGRGWEYEDYDDIDKSEVDEDDD